MATGGLFKVYQRGLKVIDLCFFPLTWDFKNMRALWFAKLFCLVKRRAFVFCQTYSYEENRVSEAMPADKSDDRNRVGAECPHSRHDNNRHTSAEPTLRPTPRSAQQWQTYGYGETYDIET